MLEVLHNVPLTSLYSPAHEKNAGDCEKQPDFITYIIHARRTLKIYRCINSYFDIHNADFHYLSLAMQNLSFSFKSLTMQKFSLNHKQSRISVLAICIFQITGIHYICLILVIHNKDQRFY